MKTCYYCKGPVQSRRIEYMARSAAGYALIKNLPADTCTQCGEVYLTLEASRWIDQALTQISNTDDCIEIPVLTCQ